jgi:hypothetical protein
LRKSETNHLAFCNSENRLFRFDDGIAKLFDDIGITLRYLFSRSQRSKNRIGKIGEIVTGREVSACSRNNDEFHVRILVSGNDEISEGTVHVGNEGIIPLGPVKGNIESVALDLREDIGGHGGIG